MANASSRVPRGPRRPGAPGATACLAAAWLAACGAASLGAAGEAAAPSPPIAFSADDRILVLAPHPDDEVLGCGGVIQQALAQGLPVRVVFLTYGDSNEWSFFVYRKHAVLAPSAARAMGMVRRTEALNADAALGLRAEALTFLGYPDFGTLQIWMTHWADAPPFESILTRVSRVPYPNALRPGAPYKGEDILRDLTGLLREFRPTRVFVSHPADFNVDHQALYLFTRVALWNLEGEMQPALFPYLVHFPHWPELRGLHADLPLDPPSILARGIPWRTLDLTPAQTARKQAALAIHKSQFEYSSRYLLAFVRRCERFGDPPALLGSGADVTPHDVAEAGAAADKADDDERLTEEERARFVGVEWRSVRLRENALSVSIALSRPLAETVSASIQAFGYRPDAPFGIMPKIRIELGALGHEVYDQRRLLAKTGVSLSRNRNQIDVEIPLTVLGDPQRILVSARTYLGDMPLDWVSWRIVERAGAPPVPSGR